MTEATALADDVRPAADTGAGGQALSLGTKTYLYVAMTIVAAIVIIPLVTTVLGGFKTLGDLRSDPFGLPAAWQWHNYSDILFSQRYWLQMGNSLLIAILTVTLTLVCSAMAAFSAPVSCSTTFWSD
jgi:raffinose/stachyose/melibiose transport system permease protein